MENIETNVSEVENITNEDSTGNVQDSTNNTQQNEKTFTQNDLDSILNKKFAQWQKKSEQLAQEKAKEVEEAEKLKHMSESDRQKREMQKQLDEFNKMKSEIAKEKLSNQITKELATMELPIEYAEYVMVEGDAEATMERLNIFAEKYKADVSKEVDRQVQDRLRGNAPKTSTIPQTKSSFTLEDLKSMSPAEINANWDTISKMKLN